MIQSYCPDCDTFQIHKKNNMDHTCFCAYCNKEMKYYNVEYKNKYDIYAFSCILLIILISILIIFILLLNVSLFGINLVLPLLVSLLPIALVSFILGYLGYRQDFREFKELLKDNKIQPLDKEEISKILSPRS